MTYKNKALKQIDALKVLQQKNTSSLYTLNCTSNSLVVLTFVFQLYLSEDEKAGVTWAITASTTSGQQGLGAVPSCHYSVCAALRCWENLTKDNALFKVFT